MKTRPIIFSAPMVRAILEGRKLQTRRVVKPEWWRCLDPECASDRLEAVAMCPYGVPGDRLYVKEACWIWGRWTLNGLTATGRQRWRFRAEPEHRVRFDRPEQTARRQSPQPGFDGLPGWVYRHARFMPRWASRITLEVVSVRVERVQEITQADALDEGIVVPEAGDGDSWCAEQLRKPEVRAEWPRAEFEVLWDNLNFDRGHGWDANPWVWRIEFRVVTT